MDALQERVDNEDYDQTEHLLSQFYKHLSQSDKDERFKLFESRQTNPVPECVKRLEQHGLVYFDPYGVARESGRQDRPHYYEFKSPEVKLQIEQDLLEYNNYIITANNISTVKRNSQDLLS